MEMAIRECADHEDRKGQQRREKGSGCGVELKEMAIHDALFLLPGCVDEEESDNGDRGLTSESGRW